jgi:dTMP kinase
MHACLISLEGISGSGKTSLLAKLSEALPKGDHFFVPELGARRKTGVDTEILRILRKADDSFCRAGHPATETALFAALRTFDYEHSIKPALQRDYTVWEDGGIDGLAVHQTLVMYPNEPATWLTRASQMYTSLANLRPAPDIAFLIKDDFEQCILRAERHLGRQYQDNERKVLNAANDLYDAYAQKYKRRFVLLDRRVLSEREILEQILERRFNVLHFPGRFQ